MVSGSNQSVQRYKMKKTSNIRKPQNKKKCFSNRWSDLTESGTKTTHAKKVNEDDLHKNSRGQLVY